MKLIDLYYKYKTDYKDYVIFIESGIFYNVYNSDVGVLHSLFSYTIKKIGDRFTIGFPMSYIESVCKKLKNEKINYIIINKDNNGNYYILDKYKTKNNMYDNYELDYNRLTYISNRIKNVYSKLQNKLFDKNIENILMLIEKLL